MAASRAARLKFLARRMIDGDRDRRRSQQPNDPVALVGRARAKAKTAANTAKAAREAAAEAAEAAATAATAATVAITAAAAARRGTTRNITTTAVSRKNTTAAASTAALQIDTMMPAESPMGKARRLAREAREAQEASEASEMAVLAIQRRFFAGPTEQDGRGSGLGSEAHFAAQSTQAQEVQQQQELGVRRLRGGDALRPDGRRSWLLVAGGRDSKRRVVSQPFLTSHYYSHRF